MKHLIDKINNLMEEKGITCLDLSKRTGIPNTTLSTLLKGRTDKFDIVKLQKVCDALHCSLNYLMDDNCEKIGPDKNMYYLDKEVAEMAEAIHKNTDLKALFDASRKIKKEDMQLVIDMINRFKNE